MDNDGPWTSNQLFLLVALNSIASCLLLIILHADAPGCMKKESVWFDFILVCVVLHCISRHPSASVQCTNFLVAKAEQVQLSYHGILDDQLHQFLMMIL